VFFQAHEAGWRKAQGIAEVEPLGQVWNAIALVKRQALKLSPTSWAAERFTQDSLKVCALVFMLSPASQAQSQDSKTRL
jgi:hypothetical protein